MRAIPAMPGTFAVWFVKSGGIFAEKSSGKPAALSGRTARHFGADESTRIRLPTKVASVRADTRGKTCSCPGLSRTSYGNSQDDLKSPMQHAARLVRPERRNVSPSRSKGELRRVRSPHRLPLLAVACPVHCL